jgi:hypothetical protein
MSIAPLRILFIPLLLVSAAASAGNDRIDAAQDALERLAATTGKFVVTLDAPWQHLRQTASLDGRNELDLVFDDHQAEMCPSGAERGGLQVMLHAKPPLAGRQPVAVRFYLPPCRYMEGNRGDRIASPAIGLANSADYGATEAFYRLELGAGEVRTLRFGPRTIGISLAPPN